jgi:hypothetical protein
MLKRLIVTWLERACVIEHRLFHNEGWLGWLWFEYLDMRHCYLAGWSSKLEDRWRTGVWRKVEDSDSLS